MRLAGAEDCIDGAALSRAVDAKLGGRALMQPRRASSLLLEGYAERTASGYRAKLRMSDRHGTALGSRELESDASDCLELSQTVTVVLAIMVDPEAAARAPEAAARELPAAPAETRPDPPGHRARDAAARRGQYLVAFARAAHGLMPAPAVGVGAAYELALGAWGGLRLEGVTFLETTVTVRTPGGAGLEPPAIPAKADFRLSYGGLAYCPLWPSWGPARLAGCLGGEVGRVLSEGHELAPGRRQHALWASASASLRGSLRLWAALELQLGLSLLVSPAPSRYQAYMEGEEVLVFQQRHFGGTLELGLAARF